MLSEKEKLSQSYGASSSLQLADNVGLSQLTDNTNSDVKQTNAKAMKHKLQSDDNQIHAKREKLNENDSNLQPEMINANHVNRESISTKIINSKAPANRIKQKNKTVNVKSNKGNLEINNLKS